MPMQPRPNSETVGPLRPSWIFCMVSSIMRGLVPRIPITLARSCPKNRDGRDIGERSDAVLRTTMPGHDDIENQSSLITSLRREANLGRGGAHFGVDGLFVFCEVLLEQADQLARGLVERGFILPGLHRIKDVRLDSRHRGRHGG